MAARDADLRMTLCPRCGGARIVDPASGQPPLLPVPVRTVDCSHCGGLGVRLVPVGLQQLEFIRPQH